MTVTAPLGATVVEFDLDGRHVVREEHYFLMALQSDAQMQRSKKDAAQFFPIWKPLEEAVGLLTYIAEQNVAQAAARTYRQTP